MESVDKNRNTAWLSDKWVWALYIFLILVFRVMIGALSFSTGLAWTITNVLHAIVTYYFFHWLKGPPFEDISEDQGKYDKLTFWEQIDNQRHYTPTRKFLCIVPVVLFLLTAWSLQHENNLLLLNVAASGFILISKLPQFHKFRLFGINKY